MKFLKKIILYIWHIISLIFIPLRYAAYCTRFPKHLHITAKEAEDMLSTLHPDNGQTCLCDNSIEAVYDLHIIVPVYNTAQYIRQCLDSIFQQETEFSFFVSLVNDGSTDNSPAMLEEYHTSLQGSPYYSATEIIHQANQGPSGARNAALRNIRGRYIMFVDSDDMLMPGAIQSLMRAATISGADISEGNFGCNIAHGFAWGKVYRSELFRNVHFPPRYWFEDTLNIFYLYPLSRRIVQVPGTHYYYRPNPNSIMHSFQGNARVVDSLWVSRRVLSDYFSQGHKAKPKLLRSYLQDILSTASHFHTLKNEQAMQALFIIHCDIFHEYFAGYANDNSSGTSLPLLLKCAGRSLSKADYRLFRAITDSI